MRRIIPQRPIFAGLLPLFLLTAGHAVGKETVQIQLQFFRVTADLPGETSLDKKLWTTKDSPEKLAGIVELFDRAKFQLNTHLLELRNGQFLWDGEKISFTQPTQADFPDDLMWPVYIPSLLIESGTRRTLKVTAQTPVQYLQRRDDGLFELKEIKLPTGVDIDIWAKAEDEQKIRLTDMLITLRWVGQREKIDGVRLSVGRPILQSRKFRFYLRVEEGRDYGIKIRPTGAEGLLLIRLRASRQ